MSSPWKVFMDAFKKASTNKIDAREEARTQGLLGPTNQDASGSFDPIQRPAPAPTAGTPIPQNNPLGDPAIASPGAEPMPAGKSDTLIAELKIEEPLATAGADDGLATAASLAADKLKTSDKNSKEVLDFIRGREAPTGADSAVDSPGVLAGRGTTEVKDSHDRFANTLANPPETSSAGLDEVDGGATLVNLNPSDAVAGIATTAGIAEGAPEEEEPAPVHSSADPEEGGENKIAAPPTASSGEDTVAEGVTEVPSDVKEGVKVEIDRFGADVASPDSLDTAADQTIGGGRQPGLVVVEQDDGEPPEEDGRFGRPDGDGDDPDDEETTTLVGLHSGRSVAAQLAESRARLAELEPGDLDHSIDDDVDDDPGL